MKKPPTKLVGGGCGGFGQLLSGYIVVPVGAGRCRRFGPSGVAVGYVEVRAGATERPSNALVVNLCTCGWSLPGAAVAREFAVLRGRWRPWSLVWGFTCRQDALRSC